MNARTKSLIALGACLSLGMVAAMALPGCPYREDRVIVGPDARAEVQLEGRVSPVRVGSITYGEHIYIMFASKSASEGFSVVHDPTCGPHGE